MHTINVNGTRLAVQDEGAGPPLLFLHGNGSRGRHWAPQVEALSSDFRCIVPDQRGYGDSAPLECGVALSLYADDAAALCRALGVARVVLVGLSMGGLVAQAAAIRHPALVAGCVVAGSATLAVSYAGPRPSEITDEILRGLLTVSFSEAFRRRRPEVVDQVIADCLSPMVVATITRWLTVPSAAAEGLDSAAVTQPTLVLGAADDVLAPVAATRAVADAVPGARYELLGGAGHMMNLEAPDAFNALLRDFLANPALKDWT